MLINNLLYYCQFRRRRQSKIFHDYWVEAAI